MNERQRPTLGFIIPAVRTQVNSQVWAGAVDAAEALDVNLIGFSGYELQRPDAFRAQANVIYDLICADNVAGLVLWTNALSNYAGPEATQRLYERFPSVPMVELELTTTITESYGYRAMGAVIHHLLDTHACRRIAFIRGPAGHQEAENRYQAYRDIVQREDLPVDPTHIVLADDWFEPSGKKAIRILLEERHATFDAVVAANDLLAMGALQELQNRGLRVPIDVAVAGFDDVVDSQYCTPSLTTVRYPLYDMGWQAVETLSAEIAGETFERAPFPVQLRIRHSCGCLSQALLQTPAGETAVPDEPFEDAFAARRHTLLDAMLRISEGIGIGSEWIEPLVETFAAEIKGERRGECIALLNGALDQTIKAGAEVVEWQEIISVLYHQLLPCLDDRRSLVRAEDLWQQARVLIGEMMTRAKMAQASEKEQQSHMLFEITDRLVTTFDVEQLMDILAQELPRLQIPGCYLSLYEDPQSPTEAARMILAYTDQGRLPLNKNGVRFPATSLLPKEFLRQGRFTLLLKALYFHEQQIGFVLFDVRSGWKNVYETVCGLISSALQGALLVRQVQEHSAKIVRQKYILETFMANVPETIYFKDRESRFTQVNHSLAVSFGLDNPNDLVGKTDFEFFPEDQARAKCQQEQEIMRTGTPVLALEEPDAGGRWALTTKMPLRDEHGDIIGTFGISHDITELKQTQQGLEDAYTEIRMLNDQLKDENLRMQTEMELAQQIQTSLLPMKVKNVHPDFEIAAVMLPADEVGGDYYDIAFDLEQNLWFSIGDVSGHGVTPGLIMMMAQTIHTAITVNYHVSPKEVVIGVNKALYRNIKDRLEADHFMTFTSLKYLGDGRFQHAGAHLGLIVYRQDSQQCELIETDGTFLNFIPDISHATNNAEFSMAVGDLLVLYTDGLTEAFDKHNTLLDIHRFQDIVRRHAAKDVDTLKDSILHEVLTWCDGKRTDDMSLVVIRRVQ